MVNAFTLLSDSRCARSDVPHQAAQISLNPPHPLRSVANMAQATEQFTRFKSLLATAQPPPLGPQRRAGTTDAAELHRQLAAFFQAEAVAPPLQPLLTSAALLWHDHLDASHALSQDIETREGSWLHGIMHRREPDYGNAKYWFKRVGPHAAFPKLAACAAELLRDCGDNLFATGPWDPFAFIDECEAAESGKDAEVINVLRQIQAAEFDVLIEHLFFIAP